MGGGNHSTRNYLIALILAAYATYCKEPVFGIFWVIAGTNLIFNYNNLSSRDKLFNYALIANGVVYLLLYYFIIFRANEKFYHSILSSVPKMLGTIALYPIIIFGLIFCIIRIFLVTIKKDRQNILADSIIFAATAYSLFYIIFTAKGQHYYMPAMILYLPPFYYWTIMARQKHVERFYWSAPILLSLCINAYNMPWTMDIIYAGTKRAQLAMEIIWNTIESGNKVLVVKDDSLLYIYDRLSADNNWRADLLKNYLKFTYGREVEFHDIEYSELPQILSSGQYKGDILLQNGHNETRIKEMWNYKNAHFIEWIGYTNTPIFLIK